MITVLGIFFKSPLAVRFPAVATLRSGCVSNSTYTECVPNMPDILYCYLFLSRFRYNF